MDHVLRYPFEGMVVKGEVAPLALQRVNRSGRSHSQAAQPPTFPLAACEAGDLAISKE
jgi:hypothetical protein